MEPLGLIISILPVLIEKPVVMPQIQTGYVNLEDTMSVLPYRGVVLSVLF